MQKRILVADDESLIRDFISSFFESIPEYEDCKIDMAVNGEDAIVKIKNKHYDLIFTDLKMMSLSMLQKIHLIQILYY